MKKIIFSLLLVSVCFCSFAQTPQRKLLFIGIDGCRWDAVVAADALQIDNLLPHAIFSSDGLTEYTTLSGTGWSNMLTGVWHTSHGVTDNSFSGSNYQLYPDFISRIESEDADLNTYTVVHWAPINDNIIQAADHKINVGTDLAVKDTAVAILTNTDPDVLFVAFDDVDHAGHSFGFSPTTPGYIEAIETTDNYISDVITALYGRPDYAHEDWLIVLTTDHGGIPAGHGGGTLAERTIFTIYNNPNFSAQHLPRDTIANSSDFHEAHFSAGTYAQPVDQAPFLFGDTQDFTIECWVKASAYTGDPALISNKDWNSGSNEGFVISTQQGKYWKVNIGDGTDRLDIQGGFIDLDKWHHLAVSFDRNGLMTAYEDGAVVGFESMANIGNINSGLPLVINQDGTTTYNLDFDGSLKDIRIWNTVIPESTLVHWASVPITPDHPYYNNLLVNWKCEDGTGNVLQDESINANHCNVSGTLNWNLNQTDSFTVYDYTGTPREPDNAVTALDWLCIPIQPSWSLAGRSWVTSCIPTSTPTDPSSLGFVIYPNPASDMVTIQFPGPIMAATYISLFDFSGKLLQQKAIEIGQSTVALSLKEMSPGIYLLKIEDSSGYRATSVIKE